MIRMGETSVGAGSFDATGSHRAISRGRWPADLAAPRRASVRVDDRADADGPVVQRDVPEPAVREGGGQDVVASSPGRRSASSK